MEKDSRLLKLLDVHGHQIYDVAACHGGERVQVELQSLPINHPAQRVHAEELASTARITLMLQSAAAFPVATSEDSNDGAAQSQGAHTERPGTPRHCSPRCFAFTDALCYHA
jgi:hypothetical protein